MRSDVESRLASLEAKVYELLEINRRLEAQLQAAVQQLNGQGGGGS